ncbi:MAG: F0F1 ATP synthase subunit alpha [Firmicutes bacterium HGW-Firmicutes-9]|jgi:F-type H+-transporting ATPase subunit alpha|nr:MAG: F0F1 ATP synthase subunit alpha [Firmicutes bacterium HGW-Firmicutes-9]
MALKGELFTAGPFGEEQIESIKQHFRDLLGQEVSFDIKQNEALIGGFLAIIDGKIYDASVAYRVKEAQHVLANNSAPGAEITAENVRLTGSNQAIVHSSAADIGKTLKHRIGSFENKSAVYEYGIVTSVGDGVVRIEGLSHTRYGEQIAFENDVYGMTMDLELDGVGAVLLNGQDCVRVGERVYGTGRVVEVPVGDELLGRVVNPIGMPLDDKPLNAARYRPVESPAPRIIDRQAVNEPLMTGLLAVDGIIPIGRGQRELIIGDRQTGKTTIAVDTIINQRGKNVNCVYVAIGQKLSTVAQIYETLQSAGSMEYTVIVVANASDCAAMQYLAPYAGCAIAEQFMYDGKDALVIYDDLSKHAVAYRAMSLLLHRPPGREAYPGDVFYLHSRLLERAGHLSEANGGGSLTALPIVETMASDISAYIPTNVISITDGQIYLEPELFHSGVRPAVNVGLSVSRVGSAAQKKAMRKVVKKLRLTLAQYRELQIFAQFGSDIDSVTKEILDNGDRLSETLKQNQHEPLQMSEQVLLLYAVMNGFLKEVPSPHVRAFQKGLLQYARRNYSAMLDEIEENGDLTDELIEELRASIENYHLTCQM